MGPLPVVRFDPASWPDPAEDGTTVLSPEIAGRLLVLITTLTDYIEENHAACAHAATTPGASPD